MVDEEQEREKRSSSSEQTLYYELEYKPIRAVPQLLAAQNPGGAPALPARGFIKHEIPQPGGRDSVEVLYPFGFAPAAPAVPAAPAAPAVPVAPVAPVVPVARAPPPKNDDDDDLDD
ncbi:hypothetical protein NFI96_004405 [Prochilodus magdalenae]|nr:hypothetical protein NFI96_004405 [Prochilodus magdalenae]